MSINVQNLSKKFDAFTAVDDLTFEVKKDHVVGFLGPNGAGKTTTLRMIVGLSKASAGSITVADVRVVFGDATSNRRVGYLPELPSFYPWMTADEYLSFVAGIFSIKPEDQKKKITEVLRLVDLTSARRKKISTYSGGMKQRLGIAQALIHDPDVLVLDEPVSALDPIGRREVLTIIERLKKGRTVLFSTHILADVDKICDDIVLINKGKLVTASSLPELKKKYAAPILEIEFIKDPSTLVRDLKKQAWVSTIEHNGTQLKIWLDNEDAMTDNTALRYFADKNIGIMHYGLRLPEMEDLFMQLVGGKDE